MQEPNHGGATGEALLILTDGGSHLHSRFYRHLCPGTLAAHARAHLVLHSSVPPAAIEGMESFSHCWVLFRFHINVESTKQRAKGSGTRYAAKVVPPRAHGKKVGVFSTRSPHRPNALGLSLCRVEAVDLKTRTLSLLGLDLVDGTPVYDIKPYIPWDSVGRAQLRVPAWVENEDDVFASVGWSAAAAQAVAEARTMGHFGGLYPPHKGSKSTGSKFTGSKSTGPETGKKDACVDLLLSCGDEDVEASQLDEVHLAIGEVVAQDPRAIHDGRGAATDSYGMTFGPLRVFFEVEAGTKGCTEGSGARGRARVVEAVLDPGDPTAPRGSYQHSIALRRRAEAAHAAAGGRGLKWRRPVREGVVDGLLELKGGGSWTFDADCNDNGTQPIAQPGAARPAADRPAAAQLEGKQRAEGKERAKPEAP